MKADICKILFSHSSYGSHFRTLLGKQNTLKCNTNSIVIFHVQTEYVFSCQQYKISKVLKLLCLRVLNVPVPMR